ncbi:MAG: tRNA preQ1(34) S-adenosylmethionine ribosyltransferase-isomerase QueA [Alphaproteobacteria bacterium]|nr:tRNA preQ1(34) S-adenosylmethionine ribosyltransferase-isomerase QueA [Alphaproteobacteria bacterium]
MKVDLFDFELPPERIATRPVTPRDAARLLVVDGANISDSSITSLPQFLRKGDVMVFNNTRVIPARLMGKRGEAKVEVTLHKRLNKVDVAQTQAHRQDGEKECWQAFAKPGKKLRLGDVFTIAEDFYATGADKLETGEVVLEFDCGGAELLKKLHRYGAMPLPPYMRRDADSTDEERYQTVFAKEAGAVAAPTAGLHYTPELLADIDAMGVKRVEVTLHVGAGTFLPVKVDDTTAHQMHSEEIVISAEQAAAINTAKAGGGRIIAVGTTAMRVLESVTDDKGMVQPFVGETSIFITPGYRFRAVDVLMTNFHLPRSTLFMLVSAFAGLKEMRAAYQHAIENHYRFYSYGDGCLLFRKDL